MAKKICGIYKITNKTNGKVYIGQSKNMKQRWNSHNKELKRNNHYNTYLQNSYNKHGKDSFEFETIIECEEFELDELEIYYIEIYRAYVHRSDSNGYNLTHGGDGTDGAKHSEQTKIGMSTRNKGKSNPYSKQIVCNKKTYNTIRECANEHNVSEKQMSKWLSGYRGMPQEFIDLGLRYKNIKTKTKSQNKIDKMVVCDGMLFSSISKASKYFGIKYTTFANWLEKKKFPQEFQDKNLHIAAEDEIKIMKLTDI